MSFGGNGNAAAKAAQQQEQQEQTQLAALQAQKRAKDKALQAEEIANIRRAGGGFGGQATAETGGPSQLGGSATTLGGVSLTRFTGP